MKFLKFSLLLLAGLLIFASCGKEKMTSKEDTLEIRTLDPGDMDGTRSADVEKEKDGEKEEEDWKACFEFVYPLTYTMPDGSTISGGDEKEIDTAIKNWYENNPDVKDRYSLIYPVVILWDGATITLNSGDEVRDATFKCKDGKEEDKGEWKPCFELVYPVSYTMPDGTTVSGNDEKETYEAIKAWYEANPDVKEEANLVYPVSIVWEKNDAPLVVDNEEEMKGVKERCEEKGDEEDKECFDLIFPLSYVLPDGTTIDAGDEKELYEGIEAWYDANPDVKEEGTFVFPIDIVFDDQTFTINNEEEWNGIQERCEGEGEENKECFELVYPLSYTMPDGTTITGGAEQIEIAIKEWYEANPDVDQRPTLVYPVDIVFEDGTTASVNNEEELEEEKEDCE